MEIFQFTPLREGRLNLMANNPPFDYISIHAPPRGATGIGTHRKDCEQISIHAPPRGATVIAYIIGEGMTISIHAPPRGATCTNWGGKAMNKLFQFTPLREGRRAANKRAGIQRVNFNSRPSARGDITAAGASAMGNHFNSRPSARGDARLRVCSAAQADFNSRPSARGDRKGRTKMNNNKISIHAPPRGATVELSAITGLPYISIHAPPRGATFQRCSVGDEWKISIHAPPRGATHIALRGIANPDEFQFTPLREGRPVSSVLHPYGGDISIHAPPRGATRPCRGYKARHEQFQFTPLREGRQ